MLLAACGGGGGGGGAAAGAATTAGDAPRRTTTTEAPDDRRTVAYGLPGLANLGAGWVELNRDPGGPDDPTLPTAPEIGPDCGSQRAEDETGAAFALFERRRAADLDEQLIVYALLFEDEDGARAQTALYRSMTFEGCVFGVTIDGEAAEGVTDVVDRPLPALADGVDGTGRAGVTTVVLDGFAIQVGAETTVLRSGRAVGLVLRFVLPGAPNPFHTDRFVAELADRIAGIGGATPGE